ncbi:MAG: pacearchaeosortase [Planctomycetota bacterium]
MKKILKNPSVDVLLRYLIILLIAIPNLWIFYAILTPLTIYATYFLFNIFFSDVSLVTNTIKLGCFPIEIINSCVAGSAYYLLLLLNFSTKDIKWKKRLTILSLAFASLFIMNIIRIFALSIMAYHGNPLFDVSHQIFWYFLSTFFVVVIWFTEVKYFKIKSIPFYTDLKFIYKKSLFNK